MRCGRQRSRHHTPALRLSRAHTDTRQHAQGNAAAVSHVHTEVPRESTSDVRIGIPLSGERCLTVHLGVAVGDVARHVGDVKLKPSLDCSRLGPWARAVLLAVS
jgi:hypothetical protein